MRLRRSSNATCGAARVSRAGRARRLSRRNLRSRRLLTDCTGCNLCRPSENWVYVGFCKRAAAIAERIS